MDRCTFETWVHTQLVPTLSEGDDVILDNLAAHKSSAAEQAILSCGAWLLFLPAYSPDLNAIEMAVSRLKAHLRARAARTIDDLWKAIGDICDLFEPDECGNFFNAAGYGFIWWHDAITRLTKLSNTNCKEKGRRFPGARFIRLVCLLTSSRRPTHPQRAGLRRTRW
jgi:transposase